MKVIVIGGGVVGMTTAYELSLYGADVTLLEKDRIGGGASGAAGGILSPLYPWQCTDATTRLLTLSRRRWPLIFKAMHAAGAGVSPVLRGILYLGGDDVSAAQRWAREQNLQGRVMDEAALKKAVPALSAKTGFLLDDVQQFVMPDLLAALKDLLRHTGVRVREGHPADEIVIRGGCLRGVSVGGSIIESECVVVCAGAWTTTVCPGLPVDCVRPVRGQMVALDAAGVALPHVIVCDGNYLGVGADGRIVVGSTVEDCGFDTAVTAEASRILMNFAGQCVPALKSSAVQAQWAGLRPAPSGADPLIGRHPQFTGLFLNTGHFRSGVALAAGSAQLTAQLIVGDRPALDPAAYEVPKLP